MCCCAVCCKYIYIYIPESQRINVWQMKMWILRVFANVPSDIIVVSERKRESHKNNDRLTCTKHIPTHICRIVYIVYTNTAPNRQIVSEWMNEWICIRIIHNYTCFGTDLKNTESNFIVVFESVTDSLAAANTVYKFKTIWLIAYIYIYIYICVLRTHYSVAQRRFSFCSAIFLCV